MVKGERGGKFSKLLELVEQHRRVNQWDV